MKNEDVFIKFSEELLFDEKFLSTKKFVQHAKISVFTHTVMVARYSVRFAERLRIKCDMKALVRGALLHDFFLYDWHRTKAKEIGGLHGFIHPVIAEKNASEHFELSKREKDVIIRHMWPLTITRIPINKEGWIVSLIDKHCSLMETLRLARYDDESVEKFLADITPRE